MKTQNRAHVLLTLVAFSIGLFLSGCATTSQTVTSQVSVGIAVDLASFAAVEVLEKNPKAVPALRSISAGIDTVITQGSVSPAQVAAFVQKIDKDGSLSPIERLIIGRAIQRVHQALVQSTGVPDLNITNPKVRDALERVKKGIDDTLALYDVVSA